jgi:hypothetical protein
MKGGRNREEEYIVDSRGGLTSLDPYTVKHLNARKPGKPKDVSKSSANEYKFHTTRATAVRNLLFAYSFSCRLLIIYF